MSISILIHGYYGFKNLGDELILKKITEDIKLLNPEARLSVLSGDPKYTETTHGIKGVNRFNVNEVIEAVRGCDVLILGGGGLFQDHWPLVVKDIFSGFGNGVAFYAVPPLIAKIFNKPVFYWTHGVGPLYTNEAIKLTKWAYSLADFVTLRDEYSDKLLLSMGVSNEKLYIDNDPVVKLDVSAFVDDTALNQLNLPDNRVIIGINLRPWKEREHLIIEQLGNVLKDIYQRNKKCLFLLIPFNISSDESSDIKVLKRLSTGLPDGSFINIAESSLTPELVLSAISKTNAVIGMRFHFLLAALKLARPAIALTYDRKVKELFRMLKIDKLSLDLTVADIMQGGDKISEAIMQEERFNDIARTINDFKYETPLRFKEFIKGKVTTARHDVGGTDESYIFSLISEDVIRELTNLRREKESLLLEKNGLLSRRDNLLNEIRKQLSDRDRIIEELRAELASKRKMIEEVHARLSDMGLKDETVKDSATVFNVDEEVAEEQPKKRLEIIVNLINERSLKGVFLITSGFEFDEFYNQRAINLSKFLSKSGYIVIYIAWRWSKDYQISGLCEEVYPNIFQVPVDYLFEHYDIFTNLSHDNKYFVIEFPHPKFFTIMLHLKEADFKSLYEIIDEWEEFKKANQSPWFDRDYEEAIIVNADILTAVSPPLIEKFSHLRSDISLIPNGFSSFFIGGRTDTGCLHRQNGKEINIGYFGHLTDSWFDWDLVVSAAEANEDFIFHIIGYGESYDTRLRISMYKNLKFYGELHPAELYRYARDWEVAILPFKDTSLSRAADPIKAYEYLFFGLPVVVEGIERLNNFPYVKNCNNLNEFQDAIRNFAGKKRNNAISYEVIERFLGECSWEKRFALLLTLLEGD